MQSTEIVRTGITKRSCHSDPHHLDISQDSYLGLRLARSFRKQLETVRNATLHGPSGRILDLALNTTFDVTLTDKAEVASECGSWKSCARTPNLTVQFCQSSSPLSDPCCLYRAGVNCDSSVLTECV
jgi:hypothetical protein